MRHPLLQLKHNFVIKTCFTTFTYLTTMIHKSRTVVSTYETVVSTVTTEPIVATPAMTIFEKNAKTEKTHTGLQITPTIQNTATIIPKIEKRTDDLQTLSDGDDNDLIQPSEVSPTSNSCSMTSCPCTVTLTESLKEQQTKIVNGLNENNDVPLQLKRSPLKPTKYGSTIIDIAPTAVSDYKIDNKNSKQKPNKNASTPSDKVVQKYTEIVNDASNEDNKNNLKDQDKLGNKNNSTRPNEDKRKPQNTNDKNKESQKPQKTKFQVADLLKLGTLGIKKLAPMIEQMTGTLKRRQELNKHVTTTIKPVSKITSYSANKRIDSIDSASSDHKPSSTFPIYIPVDEQDMETAESQNLFNNSSLHQNLIWASQNLKNSRNNIAFGKPVHESPLVNGGIPISPGEIITANSDVIVGKPAVGGPNIGQIGQTNANININLNNGPHQNFHDSHSQSSNFQDVRSGSPPRGQGLKHIPFIRDDDSYDLRPPMMSHSRPNLPPLHQQHQQNIAQSNQFILNNNPHQPQSQNNIHTERLPNIKNNNDQIKPHNTFIDHSAGSIHPPVGLENHGTSAFLDYIPSLGSQGSYQNYIKNNLITRKNHEDNAPVNNLDRNKPTPTKVWHSENKNIPIHISEGYYKPAKETQEPIILTDLVHKNTVKPFLVDIQPSRVANVLIPHGSTTALIFSGNSEPHKNGEYIDDPLPYPEPGYFGSFSIDAPHLTAVHVGGTIPLNQNINLKNKNEHRVQQSSIINSGNHPHRNIPEPSIVNHGISGLNQDVKPPLGQRWKYEDGPHGIHPPKNYRTSGQHGNLPPPVSKHETHMQFGPHQVRKPEHINMNFGPDVNIPPPIRNLYFNDGMNTIKSTTADYEADLVAPPPPPPTVQVKYESNVGVLNSDYDRFKNGGNQNFGINTRDNIPLASNVPNFPPRPIPTQSNENVPPRITSEVYYASTATNGEHFSQKLKPFSVNLPDPVNYRPQTIQQSIPNEPVHYPSENNKFIKTIDGGFVTLNPGSKVNIPHVPGPTNVRPSNNINPAQGSPHYSIPQHGGLITVNAGTSVHGGNFVEQTISGTSVDVPILQQGNHQNNVHSIKEFNSHDGESTGIPIGTNFAIKVESQNIPSYDQNIQIGVPGVPTSEFVINEKGPEIIIGGNNWKAGTSDDDDDEEEINGYIGGIPDSVHNGNEKVHVIHASTITDFNITHIQNHELENNKDFNIIHNSHANFPMIKEGINKNEKIDINQSISANSNIHVKPIFNDKIEESNKKNISKIENQLPVYNRDVGSPFKSNQPAVSLPFKPTQPAVNLPFKPNQPAVGSPFKTNQHAGNVQTQIYKEITNRTKLPTTNVINKNQSHNQLYTAYPTTIDNKQNSDYQPKINEQNKVYQNNTKIQNQVNQITISNDNRNENSHNNVASSNKQKNVNQNNFKQNNNHNAVNNNKPNNLNSHVNINYQNNVKIETTTHKVVPIPFDYERNKQIHSNNDNFGQKLKPIINTPPLNYNWQTIPKPKPFEAPIVQPQGIDSGLPEFMAPPPLTTQSYNPSYIPAIYNNNRQQVYDIPTREESVYVPHRTSSKPVFNRIQPTTQIYNNFVPDNSYKTIDESDIKGNFAQESSKIPIVSSTPSILSNEVTVNYRPYKNTSYAQSEVLLSSENDYFNVGNRKPTFNADENIGSQTEEPFNQNKYKSVSAVTFPEKITTTQSPNNAYFSQMAPRPFSMSETNKQQNVGYNATPDFSRPRPFQKQTQNGKQDSISLNIGEVPAKTTTPTIVTPEINRKPQISNDIPARRPQPFSPNNATSYKKDTDKIITSTVNLATNKPIRVINRTTTRPPTTSSAVEIDITTKGNETMIIPNLSPPPPTIDYSFVPTNKNDDTIMGMSPPPKTSPPKVPPIEFSKYNEISTYRPSYNVNKNQYRRPGYYGITSRPFTRYTTPSTVRPKPVGTKTITRIIYPSRSTIPVWRNPVVSIETKSTEKPTIHLIKPTSVIMDTVINTKPTTVSPDIMHPEVYPEETIGLVTPSMIKPHLITPSKVQIPSIYPSTVQEPSLSMLAPSIISAPSVVYRPSIIQSSEKFYNENAVKETETVKPAPTVSLEDVQKKPSKTLIHKFTVPSVQSSSKSVLNEKTIKPIHHAGNEVKQSNDINEKKPEKVTAITYTTTLSEPASTVMTTRFVTLTHTLTVTQTKTSLVSPVIGSTTQTLVLTNTQTSTVVDVVTEIHTLVQPTTIVQTIIKHVPITTLPSWETKYPKVPIEPTQVRERPLKTTEIVKLDDVSLSSDEDDFIIKPDDTDNEVVSQNNKTSTNQDNDTFFVVMNKSQNGGSSSSLPTLVDDDDFDGATRNEDIDSDGVSHILLGEIILAGTPFMESGRPVGPTVYGKECQPECQASRNERCQRTQGLMRCVCRPGFARMFPDRPCKPTYTYSLKLALSRYGRERLKYQDALADQTSPAFQQLAEAAHEGINRMVMQSDLRDVYHGVHINGFLPVTVPTKDGSYTGVINDFYVQLSDNAHETRLKEVVEKYLRTNNYSLGGTDVYAAGELVDKLEVGDFNECANVQFHDCSEHAECFNLRASYTCSCREGFADLSPNPLYPGRLCSAEAVGCEKCHYHGTCYNRDDSVLCECFQWYAGDTCQVNLKVILISLSTLGALLLIVLIVCLILGCARKHRTRPHPIMAACLAPHQSTMQSSKHHPTLDKRALIQERGNDSGGEGSSIHNVSLPYIPAKKVSQVSQKSGKRSSVQEVQEKGKPFTLMIPRAKYCPAPTSPLNAHSDNNRDTNGGGKRKSSSGESSNEAKLLSYLDGGPVDQLSRRKQSNESCYSMNKSIPQKYSTGALVSAGFKVSTTVTEESRVEMKEIPDDESSITKSHTLATLDMQSQFNSLRKAYSQEDLNDWTDAERRIGELTMSEARSFDGTLVKPAQKLMRSTTGSNKSSAHYTQHEANTMAERDLGSTFLLPHVHLYKPDMGSDVSEFDSL